jgi:phosphatidylglycerophosphatase A
VIVFCAKAFATCGFLSYLPSRLFPRPDGALTGAGLVGTLAGAATLPLLPVKASQQLYLLIGFFFLSVLACDIAEKALGKKDDPRLVLDEWIGYWITMCFHPITWFSVILGFIVFRIFDVLKPLWIRRAANLPGGWGVVVDDVLAGVVANLVVQLVGYIYRF